MAGGSRAAPGSLEWLLFVIPEPAASLALKNRSDFPCPPPSQGELGSFRTTDGEKYLMGLGFLFTSLLSFVVLHREGRAEAARERHLLSPGC